MTRARLYMLLATLFSISVPAFAAVKCPAPELISFQVESVIERSPKGAVGFTEGLEIYKGKLYESTGIYADAQSSKINQIAFDGKVTTLLDRGEQTVNGEKLFGEGLTFLNGKLYQLTYKNKIVYICDVDGKNCETKPSPLKEGWGLTNDGKKLIATDGSGQLIFMDPKSLATTRLSVRDEQGVVTLYKDGDLKLNEVEYVNGKIFANVFGTNDIIKIDPVTGCIEARADMTNLKNQMPKHLKEQVGKDRNFVLNGIAFDQAGNKFYLTGKNWPVIFKTRMAKATPPKNSEELVPGKPGGGFDPGVR